MVLVKSGLRTSLLVPMLGNDELIGSLAIGRQRIEHFTDKEIELVTDFAAEAAIALEINRTGMPYWSRLAAQSAPQQRIAISL